MRPAMLLLLALPACTIERSVAPPAYSEASPYAPGAYAAAQEDQVAVPAPGSYCEEALAQAQDAAALAAGSGNPRDAGRARRTASYAARDCR